MGVKISNPVCYGICIFSGVLLHTTNTHWCHLVPITLQRKNTKHNFLFLHNVICIEFTVYFLWRSTLSTVDYYTFSFLSKLVFTILRKAHYQQALQTRNKDSINKSTLLSWWNYFKPIWWLFFSFSCGQLAAFER